MGVVAHLRHQPLQDRRARQQPRAARPGAGESDNAYFGNPLGATISGIAPINEVNQVSFGRDRVQATAEMIQTAVSAQEFWNTPYVLYVPDVADVPTDGTRTTSPPTPTRTTSTRPAC